jgi:hypothetical protein
LSLLCVTGHKEDELARAAAHELATEFACRVNVTVGLHVDHATSDDIALLFENCSVTLAEAKRWLSGERAARS